jgi:hypothetical protein
MPMKTFAGCLALILFGSAGLVAQQQAAPAAGPAGPQSGSMTLVIPAPARPCTVAEMHATQGSSLQMMRAQNGESQPLMTPTLTLTPRDRRALLSATVTAHGYPAKPGTTPLVAQLVEKNHPPERQELTKTLTLKLLPSGTGSFSAQLQLPGFAVVKSIELNSVTYADGSTWKVTGNGCSVAPDPLLLISVH